jgi:uncharacterized membrane protein
MPQRRPTPLRHPDTGPRLLVRPLRYAQPLEWLQRGWLDLADCPWPGLLHGAAVTALGVSLAWLAYAHFWLMAGAFSACLLLAPLLTTRLHAVSRALEQGADPSSRQAWADPWAPRDARPWQLGLLLAVLGLIWVALSAAAVAWLAPSPEALQQPLDYLYRVALRGDSWPFVVWLLVGAALAAPIFALAVVAMPLMLDTPASLPQALRTSWRAVRASPGPMALWAATLLLLTLLGTVTLLLGLVLILPWLAHANWHAYRDLVECDDSVADTAPASQRWRATVRAGHR